MRSSPASTSRLLRVVAGFQMSINGRFWVSTEVIERSVIVCETENFSVDESWLSRQPVASEQDSRLDVLRKPPSEEKAIIEAALRESGGRVYGPSGAAAKLGIPRSTVESKIKSLKINKNRFKPA